VEQALRYAAKFLNNEILISANEGATLWMSAKPA
jgi:hypothetical protein